MSAVACSRGWGACDPDAVQSDSAWYAYGVRTIIIRLLAILIALGWSSQCNAEYNRFQFYLRFLTPGWSSQCKSEYPKRQNASPIARAGLYTRLRMRNNFRGHPRTELPLIF